MWEVRAYPESFTEMLSWVCDMALLDIELNPLHISSEVFSSTDHRIVVISKWRAAPPTYPDPPGELVTRSAHVWDFSPVDR
ncbi:MAG: hypothetical protein V7603_455 [Micromonosporaceae bacterium]